MYICMYMIDYISSHVYKYLLVTYENVINIHIYLFSPFRQIAAICIYIKYIFELIIQKVDTTLIRK